MKKLKHLICYFSDHKYSEESFEFGAWECHRCKKFGYYSDSIVGNEFYSKCRKLWYRYTFVIVAKYQSLKWKFDCWRGKEDKNVPF